MPRYQHNDVSFDYPRHWTDRSVVAFAAPVEPGQKTATNLVMTRDTLLTTDESLKAYADRQLVALVKQLEGFQLHAKNDISLGGRPAVDVQFEWQSPHGPLFQRLVMVNSEGEHVLNFTASVAKNEAKDYEALFNRIFSSVKFGDGENRSDERRP